MLIEPCHPLPQRKPGLRCCGAAVTVKTTADEVPEGMASKGVSAQEDDVAEHDERSKPEVPLAAVPQGGKKVPPEKQEHDDRCIHRKSVQIVEDQRKARFSPVFPM